MSETAYSFKQLAEDMTEDARPEIDALAKAIGESVVEMLKVDHELRDRFAMAALTGLIGNCNVEGWDNFAKQAYLLADAMMKARQTGGK